MFYSEDITTEATLEDTSAIDFSTALLAANRLAPSCIGPHGLPCFDTLTEFIALELHCEETESAVLLAAETAMGVMPLALPGH